LLRDVSLEYPQVFLDLSQDEPSTEEKMEALIVGLVSLAVIWLVVIYGSIYMNKNVQ
jgi:hypothetical protein